MLSLETGEWNPVVYSLQVCTKLAWCLCSVVWAFVPFYVTVLTETIWRHVKETLGNVIYTFKHKHLYHNSPLPDFLPVILPPVPSIPLWHRFFLQKKQKLERQLNCNPLSTCGFCVDLQCTGVSSIVTFWEVLELTTHTSSRGQGPSRAFTLNKAEVSQNLTPASLMPKPGFWAHICSQVRKDAT